MGIKEACTTQGMEILSGVFCVPTHAYLNRNKQADAASEEIKAVFCIR